MLRMSDIIFFINGKEFVVHNPDPELNLAYYVRNTLRLYGTKLACEEGACGACTVVLGKWDHDKNKPVYYAVNACLLPLYMVDGCSVFTVEGICKDRIHPIQERLARAHGTQCGFCSPGFTMALYALLRNNPTPTKQDINQAIKGNLCRCTGYRPILEAFYSFAVDGQNGEKSGCCGGGSNGGCPCKEAKTDGLATKLTDLTQFPKLHQGQELIFPPKLKMNHDKHPVPVSLRGKRISVECPTSLDGLKKCASELREYRIVSSGMISRLIASMNPRDMEQNWLSIHRIPELSHVTSKDGVLSLGSALSIGHMCSAIKDNLPYASALLDLLSKYSAEQVKNSASWAGALASASATSEICSLALGLNLNVNVLHLEDGSTSTFTTEKMFNAPKTILKPTDVITSIEFPLQLRNTHLFGYKQGERRGADATVINMVMVVKEEEGIIQSVRIVFGIDKKPQLATKLAEAFVGRHLANLSSTFDEYIPALDDDLQVCKAIADYEYRMSLCRAAVFSVVNKLSDSHVYEALPFDVDAFETLQVYRNSTDSTALGRPLAHQYADRHTTGEAKYVGDLKFDDLLHLCPVLSTKAHAEIVSIDPKDALELEGVVDYIDIRDIPQGGSNTPALDAPWSLMNDDTKIFADGKVESVGQVIGAVIATDVVTARRAAKLVKVEYKEVKAINSYQEAKEAKSYLFEPKQKGKTEDELSVLLQNTPVSLRQLVEIGGQEHLYMETQTSTVVPGESGEFVIYTSTQGASWAAQYAAVVLGIPSNRIVVKVKRVGGAFGGKCTQCAIARLPALVASAKHKRPVSCVLSRTDDILATGKRHPAIAECAIGASKEGKLEALQMSINVDGGHTIDNTFWVSDVLCSVAAACYDIADLGVTVYPLKTNKQSNTAFRGYGQPQCFFIMEKVIERVANHLGLPNEEVKEMNFVRLGGVTGAGQKVMNDGMIECWNECKQFAKLDQKKKDVEEFNKKSKFIKRGVCMSTTRFAMPHGGPLEQGHALVQIASDGAVSLSIGGVEMGQGLNMKVLQCASKALNLPIEKIHMLELGTDKTINAPVTGGSQGADVHGRAVKMCCDKLMTGLQPLLEKNNGDWEAAVREAFVSKVPLQASEHMTLERESHGVGQFDACYFTSGAACAVVEVDCLTGEHRVLSVDIVMDVGESLNPAIDIGQIEGGFIQGYGLMTCEELTYDNNGKLKNDSAYKYKIPTVQMCPEAFRVKLLEGVSNFPEQIYASKGIGEPPLMLATSVHTAISNAIRAYRLDYGLREDTVYKAPLTAKYIQTMANENLNPLLNKVQ